MLAGGQEPGDQSLLRQHALGIKHVSSPQAEYTADSYMMRRSRRCRERLDLGNILLGGLECAWSARTHLKTATTPPLGWSDVVATKTEVWR